MVDDARSCDSTIDEPETEPTTDRWIADAKVLDAALPSDVQETLGQLLGTEPVETLGDWVAEVRRHTGDESIAIDDLCHASIETGHLGEMDGKTYHFRCFYDAVILSALAETPVDIRTESPDGAVIEARAVGTTELTVIPETAVFSFGVRDPTEPVSNEGPSPVDVYAAVCPYVRAFPRLEAYERWVRTVPAATVALPLAGATNVAAKLVE
ncbi:organomercurial lyase [Haladaptatus salinisoli]|uniref:organomercurial lyase n=1 Tax=Haladaptatus salinisoli TaxID=2884876 RepID=UPI001D0A54A1|nr:organomercurial lyase [Haladaptatus salinisoli]